MIETKLKSVCLLHALALHSTYLHACMPMSVTHQRAA